MNIKFRVNLGDTVTVNMSRLTKVGKAFHKIVSLIGKEESDLRFQLDGEHVLPIKSPIDLDLDINVPVDVWCGRGGC